MTTFSNSNRVAKRCAALAALAATLTACGGGGGEAATPTPPVSGTPAPTPPAPPPPPPASPPPSTPAPATYKVGGSATGLDGTVVLRTSGGETVSVTATGATTAFEFPTAVATGATYAVAVAVLPSKQNCEITNGQGTVATANVVGIGVACTTRAWTAGLQLDGDDTPVPTIQGVEAGMDQEGRVTAVLRKGNGASMQLLAVRGAPGTATGASQWSTPVRIDTAATPIWDNNTTPPNTFALAVAPNGNAHVVYAARAACSSQTWRLAPSTCTYLYSSTYSVGSNSWSTPLVVSDAPGVTNVYEKPIALINNQGDVAVQLGGYIQTSPPTTANNANLRGAVAWRGASQTAFQVRAFDEIDNSATYKVVLDNAGGIVVASERRQSGSTNNDIVTQTGSVSAGFPSGTGSTLDGLGNSAALRGLVVGPTNDILVTWDQNDTTGPKYFSASKTSASAAWSAPAVIAARASSITSAGTGFVAESGDAFFLVGCTGYVRTKASGVWAPRTSLLPSNCSYDGSDSPFASDGSYLTMNTPTLDGVWNVYNQTSNSMSRAAGATLSSPDYLLRFAKVWGNQRKVLFVKKPDGNYIGAYLATEAYDNLPTPTATSGDGRSGIVNLWGFYLK